MDIQSEKLNLINWLIDVNDQSVIEQLIAIKESDEQDWWDRISVDERAEIEEGLLEADNNDVLSHEEAMSKYDKWRNKGEWGSLSDAHIEAIKIGIEQADAGLGTPVKEVIERTKEKYGLK